MNILKLAIVSTVSWLAGGADLTAVLFWSFAAALLALPLIYLPVMFLLRRLLRGYKPAAAFPVVASLMFVLPAGFILGMFSADGSGFLHSFVSPEALLFYWMFVAVGVTFGLGFVWCFRKAAI